jgi:hypothetical protein
MSWRQPKGRGRLAVDWVYRNCDLLLGKRMSSVLLVLLVVRLYIRITHFSDKDSSATNIGPYAETAEFRKVKLSLSMPWRRIGGAEE